ncbi:MAG: hypothetical protein ABI946_08415 [Chthoniobacterales bacterium]
MAAGIVIFSTLGAFALVAREVRKAPEAYEDEYGFHIVQRDGRGADLPSAGVSNVRKPRQDAEARRPIVRPA